MSDREESTDEWCSGYFNGFEVGSRLTAESMYIVRLFEQIAAVAALALWLRDCNDAVDTVLDPVWVGLIE